VESARWVLDLRVFCISTFVAWSTVLKEWRVDTENERHWAWARCMETPNTDIITSQDSICVSLVCKRLCLYLWMIVENYKGILAGIEYLQNSLEPWHSELRGDKALQGHKVLLAGCQSCKLLMPVWHCGKQGTGCLWVIVVLTKALSKAQDGSDLWQHQ